MVKKLTGLRVLILSKNLMFFLFLLFVPLFVLSIFKSFVKVSILNGNDNLFFATINYASFLLLFFFFYVISKKEVDYFSNENWFYSLGNALIPSILAFGLGFLSTIIFIFLSQISPLPSEIKEWITLPNQGYIEVFLQINANNKFLVILWFFYIIVIAPFTEEILFRGSLQKFIGRVVKFKDLDCLLVALIFSFFHINSLSNALFSFIVGFFLSKARKKSGKINRSIWIHSIINFIGLLYGIIFEYKSSF